MTSLRSWRLVGRGQPPLPGGLAALALSGALLAVSRSAAAAEGPLTRSLDVAVRTDVPVLVGATVTWEGPARLRGRLTAGTMPGPYVDLTNAAMTGFDIYSDTVADIIDHALRRSIVLRVEGGFRPLPRRGLTLGVGYQLLTLGGDSADLSLFGEASDPVLVERARSLTGDLEVGITDHMLTGEVGYEWPIREHLLIGTSLGFAYTVSADSRVSPTREADGPLEQEVIDAATASTADYLTYVFEEWVHLPMIGVSVGWRFKPHRSTDEQSLSEQKGGGR